MAKILGSFIYSESGSAIPLNKLICIFKMGLPSATKVLDILLILAGWHCFLWGITEHNSRCSVMKDGYSIWL